MANRMEKIATIIVIGILLLSLLPVMYLGRYNHPTGDDYYYGVETKAVWEKTGNVAATLAEAARGVAYQYENWQGTYSAMFLMFLPPNIFGEWAYRLFTCILLFTFSGGMFYLFHSILCVLFGASKNTWLIVTSLVLLICVQTVPSQGETFFWYNGSMYYTGFFSVAMIFWGIVLRYLVRPGKWQPPLMVLLAVFLAGGNYVSLLPLMLLMGGLLALLIVRRSKRGWVVGIALAAMLLGFVVSAAAPGNAVRQEGMWKIPAWKAIAKSLLQGIRYAEAWTGIWLLIALLLATPFLWKIYSGISFRFRFPALVIAFGYGTFCSMSCPVFYTMNSTGPARVVAIVYYGYILTVFVCYGYLLGYLHRRIGEKPVLRKIWMVCLTAGVMLAGFFVSQGDLRQFTSSKAVELLANGEAAAYDREYQNRLLVLEDDEIKDVVFDAYVNQPDMLYVGDFTSDAQHATNVKIAQYFDKYSIRVEY